MLGVPSHHSLTPLRTRGAGTVPLGADSAAFGEMDAKLQTPTFKTGSGIPFTPSQFFGDALTTPCTESSTGPLSCATRRSPRSMGGSRLPRKLPLEVRLCSLLFSSQRNTRKNPETSRLAQKRRMQSPKTLTYSQTAFLTVNFTLARTSGAALTIFLPSWIFFRTWAAWCMQVLEMCGETPVSALAPLAGHAGKRLYWSSPATDTCLSSPEDFHVLRCSPRRAHRDRKSTRLNSSHRCTSRMPSSA